ncbi:MAG: PLD nuclease N-terminal domain-containing protein [Blautia sp.]
MVFLSSVSAADLYGLGILLAGIKWYFVNGFVTVLGVLEVVYVANERSNPAFKLAWTIVILALPIFGSLLYLFVETQPATKWINERLQSMHAYSKKYWKQDKEVLEELEKTNDQVAHLSRYVNHYGGFRVQEYFRQIFSLRRGEI